MGLVSTCFSRRDASTDMQHDLSSSRHDLDLKSNFDLDLSRSTCICFDAPWQEEHDSVRIIPLAFLVQKLFAINDFCQKRLFWPFLTSIAYSVEDSSNLTTFWRKSSSRAINCAFPQPPTYNSFRNNSSFPKTYGMSRNLTFDDLWWPQYWPERKNDICSLEMFFDELSNYVFVSRYDAQEPS